MIQRFRLTVPVYGGSEYEVFQFSSDIYFVRSLDPGQKTGYLKGVSIWRNHDEWTTSGGYDKDLIHTIGKWIEISGKVSIQQQAEVPPG